ncbi:hypothetical protein PGB28_03555 [Primorskyibacter aestuariivivens]|uniref:hypothetical protein n=1 Tax=Primorskyibacter aestuariivivens TaxID=1888912 RepID=UPI00230170C5|nr:hypothetical protein [Primorskyibacter aestuariivivens]MDA7427522.1 hypothetical protein [Primorskyibacter aestuariivivens]
MLGASLGIIVGVVGIVHVCAPARAQEWIPPVCCPNTDCQTVTSLSVVEVRGGYMVEGVKGIVPHSDPRVRPSQDGRFHACIRSRARPYMTEANALIAGGEKELKCLFIPLMG